MNSQTRGLAEAVGVSYHMFPVRLRLPWRFMPVSAVPAWIGAAQGLPALTRTNAPRLVISCGRHGIVPALALKRRLGEAVFTVHVQDPQVDPSRFDMVVVPRHDGVEGPNVQTTMGAIHYVTPAKLAAARETAQAAELVGEGRMLTVLLGGTNRYYEFTREAARTLCRDLLAVAQCEPDLRLVVLGSNRTAPEVLELVRAQIGPPHYVWDGEGANPYFCALALADYFVVTSDSVSMVTEAAATGRPVFVAALPERRMSRRFEDFHQMFERAGITRRFDAALADWTYPVPNDTPMIAERIRKALGSHAGT